MEYEHWLLGLILPLLIGDNEDVIVEAEGLEGEVKNEEGKEEKETFFVLFGRIGSRRSNFLRCILTNKKTKIDHKEDASSRT